MVKLDFRDYGDELTTSEREEIDYVVVLSLAEEDITKGNPKEANKQHPITAKLEEDEQLANAIQENLEVPPLPRCCKGCNTHIVEEGQPLRSMGVVWHPDCFRCYACNHSMTDQESVGEEDNPFHKSCYKEQYYPKCDVCKGLPPAIYCGC